MTLIDVTKAIRDATGKKVEQLIDGDQTAVMTVRSVCIGVLMARHPDEQTITEEEMLKRFKLAMRISDEDKLDLTADEIVTILLLVGRNSAILIYGRMVEALDPGRLRSDA